jgi:hypothetical protein
MWKAPAKCVKNAGVLWRHCGKKAIPSILKASSPFLAYGLASASYSHYNQ